MVFVSVIISRLIDSFTLSDNEGFIITINAIQFIKNSALDKQLVLRSLEK